MMSLLRRRCRSASTGRVLRFAPAVLLLQGTGQAGDAAFGDLRLETPAVVRDQAGVVDDDVVDLPLAAGAGQLVIQADRLGARLVDLAADRGLIAPAEIGRASCRERV